MRPVQEWSPKRQADALTSCEAARQKYLRLGREIQDGSSVGDLTHTHSKLGIFLAEVLGADWTEWITGDDASQWEGFSDD